MQSQESELALKEMSETHVSIRGSVGKFAERLGVEVQQAVAQSASMALVEIMFNRGHFVLFSYHGRDWTNILSGNSDDWRALADLLRYLGVEPSEIAGSVDNESNRPYVNLDVIRSRMDDAARSARI